jgi:peptidoglycan/LPS O-acetylase OafA/YrhL
MTNERVPGQLPALTGVRILAAFWVLAFHFSQINVDTGANFSFGFMDPVIRRGFLGVDVFFVLSGFILTHVYRTHFQNRLEGAAWRDFLRFRIARLYPVHLVSMALMGGMFLIAARAGFQPHQSQAFTLPSLLANLTLTHVWFPGVAALNTPAWSISAEWFAYLWFPAVYFTLWRLGTKWIWVPACFCIAVCFLVPEWSPLTQISAEFILGIAAYEIRLRYTTRLRSQLGSALAATGAILVIYIAPVFAVPAVMVASACAFMSLAGRTDILGRVLSTRLMVYGGEISYSLYMFHWVVWSVLRRSLGVFLPQVAISHVTLMIVATLLSFATAIAAYHWIELPGRKFLRAPRRASVSETGLGSDASAGQSNILTSALK